MKKHDPTQSVTDTSKPSQAPSRRKFLKAGAAAAAGASALAFPMVSRAQTTTLKMQGAWGAKDIFNEYAEQYVSRVNEMGAPRLKIDYLTSGSVVKAFQVQDAVNKGVLDAGHQVVAYWYGKNKAASLFGTGPQYGQNGFLQLAWMSAGEGKELYVELVQKILGLNLVGFFAMPMPTQPLGWFKKRITSVDQLKGLKYRTVGLATDVMEAMGVKVTQLPGGEIIPALERGVIEAFEYNNPTSDMRFGAADVSKVYMMGSFHQAAEFFEIIFNKTKYDALAPEQQKILEYAAEAASTSNFNTGILNYSHDLQKLIHEDGVNVYRTPESVMKAQLDAWDEVIAKLSQDPFFNKAVTSYKNFAHLSGFYWHMNQAPYKLAYDHYFPGELGF